MTSVEGERTVRVGPKGQVVIPKRIRDTLGLEPGDEVSVSCSEGEAHVRPAVPLETLRGSLAGGATMDEVEELRRDERRLERRRSSRLAGSGD